MVSPLGRQGQFLGLSAHLFCSIAGCLGLWHMLGGHAMFDLVVGFQVRAMAFGCLLAMWMLLLLLLCQLRHCLWLCHLVALYVPYSVVQLWTLATVWLLIDL